MTTRFPDHPPTHPMGWLNELRESARHCLAEKGLDQAAHALPDPPVHVERPQLALWRVEDPAGSGHWWVLSTVHIAEALHEDYPSDWDYILLKFSAQLRNRAWQSRHSDEVVGPLHPEELEASARWMESLALQA